MVTKATKKKGSGVKVGKLKLNKETVKNLTKTEGKKIKGGKAITDLTKWVTCKGCPKPV